MIGETNIQHALANHTRSVWIDNLQVGTGATLTTIPLLLKNPAAVTPDFGPSVQSDLTGAIAHFLTGANQGKFRAVTAATASSITIETLSVAPADGDQLVILKGVTLQVTAPENITQVGGVTVPTYDIPRVPTANSNTPQAISAVGTGAIAANGPLLAASYTVTANGSIVLAVALAVGATSSALQVTRNASAGTPFYTKLNNGNALVAQNEFDSNIPVQKGDVVQFQLVTATTLGMAEFCFVAEQ